MLRLLEMTRDNKSLMLLRQEKTKSTKLRSKREIQPSTILKDFCWINKDNLTVQRLMFSIGKKRDTLLLEILTSSCSMNSKDSWKKHRRTSISCKPRLMLLKLDS